MAAANDENLSRPWWRSWNVAAITGIIAAIAPATAAVQGCMERSKQIAIEQEKTEHELRMAQQKNTEEIRAAYLDRLRDSHERRRILRFLAGTSMDPKVADWATKELALITTEADDQLRQYVEAKKIADAAYREAMEASQRDTPLVAELKRDHWRALQLAADTHPGRPGVFAAAGAAAGESQANASASEQPSKRVPLATPRPATN
jgi:hypothetical protein